MPLGTGSRYDPATGERQDYEFEYTPASQLANQGGMQFDMRKAMEQLGVKQAEQAMIAATRFQGQRGYQQDLQRGAPPDQALAKWAPLMFFGSSTSGAGSMINALKPQQMSPYQQGMLNLAQQREKRIGTTPPPALTPYQEQSLALRKQEQERLANIQAQGNPMRDQASEMQRIRLLQEASQLAENSTVGTKPYNVATNNIATLERMAKPAIPAAAPVTPATNAPALKPTAPKPGYVYKGYRFKGGDPSKKANWEKIE